MAPPPNLQSDDYYKILGCSRDANENAIKKAYRKLAVKWHPDKNPDNEEATQNFQKISEAYATLSDPTKRRMYDQYGKEGAQAAEQGADMGGGGFPGGGFPGGGGGGGMPGGATRMSPEEAQKIFSTFFGGNDPFAGFMDGGSGMPGGGGGTAHFSSFGGGGDGMPGMTFTHSSFGGPSGGGGGGGGFGGGGPGGLDAIFQQMGGGGGGGGPMMMNPMMGQQQSQQQQQPKSYDIIPPGTIISLQGLINASDRNGDRAVIQQYLPSTRRYQIQLEDSDETMSVKPINILQHAKVRIHDIKSQPNLNGKTGTVLTWEESRERYMIYVNAEEKVVSLKPGNVILDVGTVGRVVGLEGRRELNGMWGTVTKWVRESNRYDVQLSADRLVRLKVENLRV